MTLEYTIAALCFGSLGFVAAFGTLISMCREAVSRQSEKKEFERRRNRTLETNERLSQENERLNAEMERWAVGDLSTDALECLRRTTLLKELSTSIDCGHRISNQLYRCKKCGCTMTRHPFIEYRGKCPNGCDPGMVPDECGTCNELRMERLDATDPPNQIFIPIRGKRCCVCSREAKKGTDDHAHLASEDCVPCNTADTCWYLDDHGSWWLRDNNFHCSDCWADKLLNDHLKPKEPVVIRGKMPPFPKPDPNARGHCAWCGWSGPYGHIHRCTERKA